MPRGGYRPNARGPKKGAKYKPTLDKALAREALRAIVLKHMDALVAAQIDNAKGLKYLVTRDKTTGKFVKVTEAMAGALKGDERVEVWEKDPSVAAFTDLMNRTLDLPAKPAEDINLQGDIVLRWEGE